MLHPDFSNFPILQSDRIILRETLESDVAEMLVMRSDRRIMKYIDREPAKTDEDALNHIRKIRDMQHTNTGISWVVSLKDDPKLIGTLGFWRFEPENHRAEIGYGLHYDFHGKGLMSEAIKLALDYGFGPLGLHSVCANINPENKESEKLLLKTGFKAEAYFREDYYFNGKFLDSKIYCLLASDPRP